MWLAWILTVLAICGAWTGAFLGHDNNRFQHHLAAAGGGLLTGISLFWLVPEIGDTSGVGFAILLATGVAGLLMLLESRLAHSGHSARHGVVWPLLLATAIHSLLDGWSVCLLSGQPLTSITVMLGLALHKVPEGAAVGWITRRSLGLPRRAFVLSGLAELMTLVGALVEPSLNASGVAHFGAGWSVGVLVMIAGGFLFLGLHAILPAWKRLDVLVIFLGMAFIVGGLSYFRSVV